jgi:hypothetical protein
MVANRHSSSANTASASGTVIARRRKSRCGSSTGLAAFDHVKKILQKGLAFRF